MPYSHKQIDSFDYYEAIKYLKPGFVLLSATFGELSNLFIPHEWKHAAIYAGKDLNGVPYVIEAIGPGVVKKNLLDFMFTKDRIGIFLPTFASAQQLAGAVKFAESKVGQPYDYEFKSGNKAWYCSELIWAAYKEATDARVNFAPRERFGQKTIIPGDIARATNLFKRIWRGGL